MKAYYRIENSNLTDNKTCIVICDVTDWQENIPIGKGSRSNKLYEIFKKFNLFTQNSTIYGLYKIKDEMLPKINEIFKKIYDEEDIEFITNSDFTGFCKDTSNKEFQTYYYCKMPAHLKSDYPLYAICPKIFWDKNHLLSDKSSIGINDILIKNDCSIYSESIFEVKKDISKLIEDCKETGIYLIENEAFSKFVLK